jgi:glycosyltransferase involved in cell wall biosynthesis
LQPDVVHTHTAKAGVLGRLASRLLALPCLHTYHGHILHGYFSHGVSVLVRQVERLLAGPHHHHGLTVGQVEELCYRAQIGRPKRWHCLSVPVMPVMRRQAEWHARLLPGVPVIGFLGRCAAIKDGGLWLETLAAIARQRPVQGVLCGDGDQRASLEAQAARLGVRVHFTGFVPAAEAFGAMDVLLVTSRTEGQPLVVSEAGWAGVPVVAPPVGGLKDLVVAGAAQGAARTPVALAEACMALVDPTRADARVRLLARARVHAESLAPVELVSRYEACYRAVLHHP